MALISLFKPTKAVSAPASRTEAVAAESRRAVRIGMYLLIGGLGGFLAWASLAPLNEGIPTQATVMVSTKRKPVQHAAGGVISRVLVHEAQPVKESDVLMELDATQARSVFESFHKQWLSLKSEEARLLAEHAGKDSVTFAATLLNDPQSAPFVDAQSKLFKARRGALGAEMGALHELAAAHADQLQGTSAQLTGKRRQLSLVREQMAGTSRLVQEGFYARNRLLDEERTATELHAVSGDLAATTERLRRNMTELGLRAQQRRQEWQRDVEMRLADVTRDLGMLEQRMASARLDLERTVIRAPASGTVVGLAVQAVGAVVRGGDKLMDIVPDNGDLILEAQLAPNHVDRVTAGMPADLRFSMFTDLNGKPIVGKVLSVSADQLSNPTGTSHYYLVRIGVTAEALKELGEHQLQPGMPADVLFKAGERTMLQYLTRPISRRWATALTER